MTLAGRLKEVATTHPMRVALVFEGRKYTYKEFFGLTARFAAGLRSLGSTIGGRVALLLPNCPEFAVAYFGASAAGAAVVPLNTFLAPPEIEFILNDCGAEVIICSEDLLDRILPVKDNTSLRHIVVTGKAPEGTVSFDSIVAHEAMANPEKGDGSAPAAILYTSGTTGNPKGAVLSHRNLLANASASAKAYKVTQRDRFLLFLPMFHAFSFLVCLLLPLTLGARVIILPSVKPFGRVIKAVVFGRATFFVAIPPVYNLLSMKKFPRFIFWLLPLRVCISGAAPLSVDVLERFARNYPVPLLEGYGLTEASPAVSCNPLDGPRKAGSVGIPLPGVEVKIVDADEAELPHGQVGEIIVHGENVMQGYLNNEEATLATIRNGWLFTGDLGYKDEDGYIFIVDRKKDLIISHGLNIYPREVEEAIYRHPAVRQAAVVGVPDEGRGEVPKAFVSLNDGTKLSERELKVFLKERLAAYKIPRQFEFLDALPMTPTGKILKRELKK